jgi:hypothetical protein
MRYLFSVVEAPSQVPSDHLEARDDAREERSAQLLVRDLLQVGRDDHEVDEQLRRALIVVHAQEHVPLVGTLHAETVTFARECVVVEPHPLLEVAELQGSGRAVPHQTQEVHHAGA